MDCNLNATNTNIASGIDHVSYQKTIARSVPIIANLSLAHAQDAAIDSAVARAVRNGVVVISAAGNDKGAACDFSPGRMPESITVGASTAADTILKLSNEGACIDLFAPGHAIVSAWNTGDFADAPLTGNSQSAGFTSVAAAQYLADNPTASPAAVHQYIVNNASSGKLQRFRLPDSPNKLLYTYAPPPIYVTISGPTSITAKGTYTFSTAISGTWLGTPTYTWEEKLCDNVGCSWTVLPYSSSSLNRVLEPNCNPGYDRYFIRVTARDTDGLAASDEHSVWMCGIPLAPPNG